MKNFWLNEGHSFGVTAAGGAGWQLAEWIVEGEPSIDMLGVDPRRFGPYADKGYLIEKNEEAYAKVFTIHYPDEERAAARPLRQTPCYGRMKDLGAVFGSVYGWERPNWFAPHGYGLSDTDLAKPDVLLNENHPPVAEGERPREKWSFRRSNYFKFVGEECRNVHDNVGIMDMSAFAKCEVSGPGAEGWLNSILTNRAPTRTGRVTLTYLLTKRGGVRAEFTLTRIGPERFYLISAGALETHDLDTLEKLLPADGGVRIDKVTTARGVLVLAGPRSREVLAKVADIDLSNEAFPWLTARRMSVRSAGLIAMRVNFVGELGYELHHPIEMQNAIFDALMAAGAPFKIKPFGIRAMDSLQTGEILQARRTGAFDRICRARIRPRSVRRFGQRSISWARCARRLAGQGLRQHAGHARGGGREGRRCARLRAGDEEWRDGWPHDLRRLRLAHRQVAGAGDGQS